MAHFAKIDKNGFVIEVIVAELDFINNNQFLLDEDQQWIQTSYNTFGGVHKLGGTPLRKNYAGIGFYYDKDRDAFIPPLPEQGDYTLDEDTCLWTSVNVDESVSNDTV